MVVDINETQDQLLVIGDANGFDITSIHKCLVKWHVADNTVDRATVQCTLEYLSGRERIHFFNELWRVLKPEAKATLYLPYWSSPNGVADPYLQWPPITELSLYYLASQEFRDRNKLKYTDIHANFHINYGYSYNPNFHIRHDQSRTYHVEHSIGVVRELVVTLTKIS